MKNTTESNTSIQDLANDINYRFKTLDALSANIKEFETILQNHKIEIPLYLHIDQEEESLPKSPEDHHKKETTFEVLGYTTRISWSLAWELDDEKSKKYRLMLISQNIERIFYRTPADDFDNSKPLDLKPTIRSKKAFMETDTITRLKYGHQFQVFINKFREYLSKIV